MERRESRGKGFATGLRHAELEPLHHIERYLRPKNAPLRTKPRRFDPPNFSSRSVQSLDREYYPSPPAPAGWVSCSDRLSTAQRFPSPISPPPAPFRGRYSMGIAPFITSMLSPANRDDGHGEGRGPIRQMVSLPLAAFRRSAGNDNLRFERGQSRRRDETTGLWNKGSSCGEEAIFLREHTQCYRVPLSRLPP